MSSRGIDAKLLEQSVFAIADGYCSINLTKDYIPGVMYQVVDGKLYDLNAQIGLPQDASFTEAVKEWSKTIPKEEREQFLETLNRNRLLECFAKGERLICFNYRTRTATYKEMLAEDHLAMFEDQDTGDILAVNYVIDRAKQVRLTQENGKYQQQLISFKNVHEALKSGAWNLLYDTKGELSQVNWSDTLRSMLGFKSIEDFPNTFEAWADKLHPDDKDFTLHEYELVLADTTGKKNFDEQPPHTRDFSRELGGSSCNLLLHMV